MWTVPSATGRSVTVLASLLVSLLVGCGLRLDVFPTPTVEPSLIDSSMLTGVPCQAPCWYGLVPGQSTRADVLATVQGLPFVDPRRVSEVPASYWDQSKQSLEPATLVRAECKRPGGETCASLLLFDGVLKLMYLSPPPSLTFGEAVARLGPPDAVRANPVNVASFYCDLGMIWKERAIWVAFLNGPPKKDQVKCVDVERGGRVDPDLPVGQVIYSTPDDPLFTAAPGTSGTERWPGFAQP